MGEDKCDTALGLAIGHGEDSTAGKGGGRRRREPEPLKVKLHLWFPSSTTGEDDEEEEENNQPSMEFSENSEKFPNTKSKSDQRGDDDGGGAKKKLRLSPEQSTLLEDNFRAHNTLTSLQKEELAYKLGLRPRQVEVWFQNRRARIKLKQTEVECEVLKGWCESLSEENRRLRKEMQELRFSASWRPCPSHSEENGGGSGGGRDLGKEAGNLQLCSTTYLCINQIQGLSSQP